MAKHAHHRHFDPAFRSGIPGHSQRHRRNHQPDDARGLALAVGILVDDATVTIEMSSAI